MAIHDDERRELDRLLALDPLRLRRFVPRRVAQRLYDRRLSGDRVDAAPRRARRSGPRTSGSRLERLVEAIDLFAVCDVRARPPANPTDAPNLTPPPGNPRFPLFDSLRAIAALWCSPATR